MYSDQNKFNKKLKDTTGIEREKVVLEVELQDQTAPAEWFFDDKPIETSERYVKKIISYTDNPGRFNNGSFVGSK